MARRSLRCWLGYHRPVAGQSCDGDIHWNWVVCARCREELSLKSQPCSPGCDYYRKREKWLELLISVIYSPEECEPAYPSMGLTQPVPRDIVVDGGDTGATSLDEARMRLSSEVKP